MKPKYTYTYIYLIYDTTKNNQRKDVESASKKTMNWFMGEMKRQSSKVDA